MALPWGGAELAEGAPAEVERLVAAVGEYMELRPRDCQPALAAFYEPLSENDAAAL
jgi:hypothetical protein